jgi:isoquinoline 1-oxidoreductase beta subunit
VLEEAAARAAWGTPLPEGHGRGLAFGFVFGSYCAQVAEVSAADGGAVRVHRVTAVVDCGLAVNPDGVAAQVEGAVLDGLNLALRHEITFEDGRVRQQNFHDYPRLRIGEAPLLDVHVLPSDEPPSGVGELGTPPAVAAVANAVYAATGQRVRRLPIRLA